MIKLKELAEILGQNENLVIEEKDSGLFIIEKMDEEKIIPTDLEKFVSVYEKEPNITKTKTGFKITTTEYSAQSFKMLLMGVFGAEFDFEVKGEFDLVAKKKSKEGVREENIEIDFSKIAEEFDTEDREIEIHEDGLKITSKETLKLAEEVDGKYPELQIDVLDTYILIGEK